MPCEKTSNGSEVVASPPTPSRHVPAACCQLARWITIGDHLLRGARMDRRGIQLQIIWVTAVIGAFALSAAAGEPTTQPWALRRLPSGNLLIVEDSSIAVPTPRGFLNGTVEDNPAMISPDG